MRFTEEQISIAKRLKELEMPWTPQVGHYVYDANQICPKSSPFRERVYFLLNFDCFMQHVGGLERFRNNMVWLPTWHDAREILRDLGIPDSEVAQHSAKAMCNGEELTCLYNLILKALPGSVTNYSAASEEQPRHASSLGDGQTAALRR